MKEYTYVYLCSNSSELRGRRDSHSGACGYPNTYGTNRLVTGHNRPQASPCENCGRRQRLNPGNCWNADECLDHPTIPSRSYLDGRDEHDAWTRQRWARNETGMLQMSWHEEEEEKQARMSDVDPNADATMSETQDSESKGGDKFE